MVFSITCLAEVVERNQTCENGEWSDCGAIAFSDPTRTIPYLAGVLSAPVGGSSLDSAGVSLSLWEGSEGDKGTGGRRLTDQEPGGGVRIGLERGGIKNLTLVCSIYSLELGLRA